MDTATASEIAARLLAQHGVGAKFVRALCKAMRWRYDAQGAPAEWYAAWRNGLADAISRQLAGISPGVDERQTER